MDKSKRRRTALSWTRQSVCFRIFTVSLYQVGTGSRPLLLGTNEASHVLSADVGGATGDRALCDGVRSAPGFGLGAKMGGELARERAPELTADALLGRVVDHDA